jgi:predicted nucleic acid-binding protein
MNRCAGGGNVTPCQTILYSEDVQHGQTILRLTFRNPFE